MERVEKQLITFTAFRECGGRGREGFLNVERGIYFALKQAQAASSVFLFSSIVFSFCFVKRNAGLLF